MAKKIRGEDGKVYKQQKPIYKKWWFWLIIVVVVIGAVGSQGAGKDKANGGTKVDNKTSKDNKKEDKKAEPDFYTVGDSVQVGDATYTLNGVSLSEERNQFDDSNPTYVVKIDYTMENNTDKDLPVGMDLAVYGPDDKKLTTYANQNTMGAVAPGKKMDVSQHFGLDELGDIEMQFSPLISVEKTANFKATVAE